MKTFTMSQRKIERIKEKLLQIKNRNIKGDILEFGVFEGHSLSQIKLFLIENNMQNRIIGFDSFSGLPSSDGPWIRGEYSSSIENTKKQLNDVLNNNMDNILLIEGIFENSLNNTTKQLYNINDICLIHIDSDLYSSAKTVLEWCKNLLKPNVFIVFDEWDGGENKAWQEFIEQNNDISFADLGNLENQQIFEIINW